MKQHFSGLAILVLCTTAFADQPNVLQPETGYLWEPIYAEERRLPGHVRQQDILDGKWSTEDLLLAGEQLFVVNFSISDGAGRPGTTGDPTPTRRPLGTGLSFTRTAGPDANACSSCHRRPNIGGAGDFVSNVFTGLGSRHPIFESTDAMFSNERDTPGLYGAGAIELLAREMTIDLHDLRRQAVQRALESGSDVTVQLKTKGVSFGEVVARKTGSLDLSGVQGVDRDLVVRPWGHKGSVTSLRTFSVNASNLHHGMQADERFGLHLTGVDDHDRDGISEELTRGDITAMTVFQAALGLPGRILPQDSFAIEQIERGEKLFAASQCSSCHIPKLPLRSAIFSEPGPFNLEGTLRDTDSFGIVEINLETETLGPGIERDINGQLWVRAFTDLKRHSISDASLNHFGNETLVEGLVPTDEFLTKRLWDVGSSAPYGHRGDLTTVGEAIFHHGGAARSARDQFFSMSRLDQDAIVSFLHSMRAVPRGGERILYEPTVRELPYEK